MRCPNCNYQHMRLIPAIRGPYTYLQVRCDRCGFTRAFSEDMLLGDVLEALAREWKLDTSVRVSS